MSQYYADWLRNYEIYKLKMSGVNQVDIAERTKIPYKTIIGITRRVARMLKECTTHIDNVDKSVLYSRYMNGEHSIFNLSKEFKATPDVIVEVLRRMNVHIKVPEYKPTELVRRKKRVENMLDAGASKRDVADDLGISVRTVESDMQDAGFIPVENVVAFKGKRKDYTFNKTQYCAGGILDFISRKDFLNFQMFPMQQLILKIYYGLELDAKELKLIERLIDDKRCTWDGTNHMHKELVLVAGMRGSKTVLASVMACIEEHECYKQYITKGSVSAQYGFADNQQIFILIVATNETQALDTSMAAVRSRIRGSDYYKARGAAIKELETDFKFFDTNLTIRSGHSNSASLAGKTSKAVIIEELSRFKDSRSGNRSSRPVYETVTRGTASFGNDGKIINITSPLEITDFCFELFEASRDIDNMVGFILPTWEMHPNIKRYKSDCTHKHHVHLEAEFRKNPEGAERDYGCECSKAMEAYFRMQDKIDDACKVETSPIDEMGRFSDDFRGKASNIYFMHGDPAVKNDRFGICVAHPENDKVVVDLLHFFEAPKGGEVDIEEIEQFFMNVLDRFQIDTASFDTWAIPSVKQAIEKRGVRFENLLVDKEVYDNLKDLIYNDRLICFKNDILIKELKGLLLINGKKIDHLRNNSKDLSDGLAGAIWWAAKYITDERNVEARYGERRVFSAEVEDVYEISKGVNYRSVKIDESMGV